MKNNMRNIYYNQISLEKNTKSLMEYETVKLLLYFQLHNYFFGTAKMTYSVVLE